MWDGGYPHGTTRPGHLTLSESIDTANLFDQGLTANYPRYQNSRNVVFDLAGIQTGRPK